MKKNVAMSSVYSLHSKIWKKLVFYVVIRREKTPSCTMNKKRNNGENP